MGLKTERKAEYDILDVVLHRWSPRSLTGESLSDEEFWSLFEAARWAPSSFNGQPWRFVVAKRETAEWNKMFALLSEFNQSWAKNAAFLVVVVSQKNFEYNGKPNRTHSFCTGAAWENVALEATSRGLVAHGMAGFDYDRAKGELGVPDDYKVEAMVAIGKLGKVEDLPKNMQDKEYPSERKPARELVFNGTFGVHY